MSTPLAPDRIASCDGPVRVRFRVRVRVRIRVRVRVRIRVRDRVRVKVRVDPFGHRPDSVLRRSG